MRTGQAVRVLVVATLAGAFSCTFSEPRIRPEPILYFAANSSDSTAIPKLNGAQAPTHSSAATLLTQPPLHCAEWAPWLKRKITGPIAGFFSGGASALDECIYSAVDAQELLSTLTNETSASEQNETLRSMITVSD